ncbi:aminotransferase class I/II-fold pyridoxal phosphate-dependent enzyme [Streptomyces sioyaensis]|uniref:aminotransferase class I/II-fold pyridoxal phosphate-dependent enzyme n=1 Tax=Streptomyces sioyaensis TaxID=67364 RepID=UPI0037A1B71B
MHSAQEAASRPLGYAPANGIPELRRAARAILRQSRHLDTPEPDGAFYLFPRLATGDDLAAADTLLEAGCATVPGSAFGAPGHLRLSFATDLATMGKGCRLIVAALDGIPA